EDHLVSGAVAGDIKARLEPQAHPHDVAGSGIVTGCMGSRSYEQSTIGIAFRLRQGHAESVVDSAGRHLVVAHQSGENGQAGGIGRSPAVRTMLGVGQVPDGTVGRTPGPSAKLGLPGLVEPAFVLV